MPDVLLFDLFGVIARDQSATGRTRLAETAGVPEAEFAAAYWRPRPRYDRGEVGASQYWREVAGDLGITVDERRIGRLVDTDVDSWSAVDDEMVALVEEMASAGRRVALLSNIPEELAAHYERHQGWLARVERYAFSCRIGHAKPEPAAFRWCVEALGVAPEHILFIDDRAENTAAAGALGLRTHRFTTAGRLREALVRPAGSGG